VLFTAATKEYADAVLKAAKIERFFSKVYYRDHCLRNSENKLVKNLQMFGKPPSDILLVDDSIVHVVLQPANILLVKPYKGESEDKELYILADFLKELSQKRDVRSVMERFAAFKIQTEFTNGQNEKSEILNRKIETKFMQKLKISPKHKTSPISEDSNCDFDTYDESCEDSFAQQLPLANKQPVFKSSKSFGYREVSTDASLTKDSFSSVTEPTAAETPRTPFNLKIGNLLLRQSNSQKTTEAEGIVLKV
jgi:hypothetical protein